MDREQLRRVALFAAGLTLIPALTLLAQGPQADRKVVFSLEPDEELMRAESVIGIAVAGDQIILVLSKGQGNKGPFFVFKNGRRQGPFPGLKGAMDAAYPKGEPSSGRNHPCAEYRPADAPPDAQPETREAQGGQSLVFKGKESGPYTLIYSHRVTPDGSRVYFTANAKDGAYFGCSDGRKVAIGGMPGEFKFSPNGQNAAVLGQGTLNYLDQKKLASLPPMQVAADMEKKFLYTIDGKKFGPFKSGFGGGYGDFWFSSTGNDLYYEVDDQLFRNGVLLMKTSWVDPCSFYPSPDGKKYAVVNYENIFFSDRQKYSAPMDYVVFAKDGQTIFRWITLENDRDLVIYQRAM